MSTSVRSIVLGVVGLVALGAPAHAGPFADWAPAQKIDTVDGNSTDLNTPQLDGCPIQSPDGLSLYMAPTPVRGRHPHRPGHLGGPPRNPGRPVR